MGECLFFLFILVVTRNQYFAETSSYFQNYFVLRQYFSKLCLCNFPRKFSVSHFFQLCAGEALLASGFRYLLKMQFMKIYPGLKMYSIHFNHHSYRVSWSTCVVFGDVWAAWGCLGELGMRAQSLQKEGGGGILNNSLLRKNLQIF